ncbi:MAG: hypothetical protein ACMVO5_03125 [Polymorphobacter sp.]|uniref:hypothetical protein n=1 Tax=Polymorphobacter sp. TaxID=1909290 RepID=UPI003A84A550
MDTNALYASLPDLSARIMRSALVSEFKVDWESFCRSNSIRPVLLDDRSTELLAKEEIMLQQGFADCTANTPSSGSMSACATGRSNMAPWASP